MIDGVALPGEWTAPPATMRRFRAEPSTLNLPLGPMLQRLPPRTHHPEELAIVEGDAVRFPDLAIYHAAKRRELQRG